MPFCCGWIRTFQRPTLPPSSPWRWRQQALPRRWYPPTTKHGITTQKTWTWIRAVKTSNDSTENHFTSHECVKLCFSLWGMETRGVWERAKGYITRSSTICTVNLSLLGWLNQERWCEQDMKENWKCSREETRRSRFTFQENIKNSFREACHDG